MTTTGTLFTIVETHTDVSKQVLPSLLLFEVVCGPYPPLTALFSAVCRIPDTALYQILARFHFCERYHGHIGTGASGPSREMRRRMVLNSRFGMATSAI